MKKTNSKMVKKLGALCIILGMLVALAVPASASTDSETFVKTGRYRCSEDKDCGLFWSYNQKYDEYRSITTGDLLYQHAGFGVCC